MSGFQGHFTIHNSHRITEVSLRILGKPHLIKKNHAKRSKKTENGFNMVIHIQNGQNKQLSLRKIKR